MATEPVLRTARHEDQAGWLVPRQGYDAFHARRGPTAVPDAVTRPTRDRFFAAVRHRARTAGAARVDWRTPGTNATAMRLHDQVATCSGFVVSRQDP